MPPFTSWFMGADNIGWLIGNECPGGANDMPMLRDPGQRPAGVRPLHAHARGRLRAVPAPGPGAATATGSGTSTAFFDPRCSRGSGCPMRLPAGHVPTRAPRRARSDRHARRVRRAARPGTRLHLRAGSAAVRDDLLDRPTPCAGWDLGRPARPHGGRARRLHRGGRRRGRGRSRPRAGRRRCRRIQAKALRAARRVGAARAGRRGARGGRPDGSTCAPRCWSRPPRSRSPCTGGTSAGRPAPPTRCRRAARRASCCRWRSSLVGTGGPRRPVRRTPAGAGRRDPADERLLAFLGRADRPDWTAPPVRRIPDTERVAAVPRVGPMLTPRADVAEAPARDDRHTSTTVLARAFARARAGEVAAALADLEAARREHWRPARRPPARGAADHPRSTAGSPAASSPRRRPTRRRAAPPARRSPARSAPPRTSAAASWPPHAATPRPPLGHYAAVGVLTARHDDPFRLPWRAGAALAAVRLRPPRRGRRAGARAPRARPRGRLAVRHRPGAAHPRHRRRAHRPDPARCARPAPSWT